MKVSDIYKIEPDKDGWRKLPNGNLLKIGEGVSIHETAVIEDRVRIGSYVWISSGALIRSGVQIDSNVWINPDTRISSGVQIGSNAQIGPDVKIGPDIIISSGTIIKKGAIIKADTSDQTRSDQIKAEQRSVSANKLPREVEDFVDKYHEICHVLKKVRIVNKSRQGNIKQRLKELDKAGITVEEYMTKIANSKFLRGERGNWDRADFDFIVGAKNIGKILDGKYDDREGDIDWDNLGKDNED